MRYIIWGCGIKGKMLLDCMSDMDVVAFVDNDEKKFGTKYNNIPIISFEMYLNNYRDCYLILSQVSVTSEMIRVINQNGIDKYLDLNRCPKELPGWGGKLPFDEMVMPIKSMAKKVVLLGVNLFSIMLYDFLKDKADVFFACVDEQRIISNELNKGGEYRFIEQKESEDAVILKTDSFLDKTLFKESKGICFYRFPYLKKYDYPSLKQFHNVHAGKRCFIVATGPSLRMEDLDCLYNHKEICISMNEVYKAFNRTKWRPKYLFYEDSVINRDSIEELKKAEIEYKFLADRNIRMASLFLGENRYVYRTYSEYYEDEGPYFSENIDVGTFFGYTVLYQCLQFAIYMGFSSIYIIGADCEYKNYGGSGDHFIDDYTDDIDDRDNSIGVINVKKMFLAYKSAQRTAEERSVKIYNATRGGKLEVFERVNFDSLFSVKPRSYIQ